MLGRPIIGHLDADCFYVSCERLRFPGLRGKPVGVLGNQGACVIAKSYEMKKAGVKTGGAIWDMQKLCPDGIYVKRDFYWYEVISKKILDLVKEFSISVEYYSIDELFFDARQLPIAFGLPMVEAARALQQRILKLVGIPVSIGVAPTKTLAKLVSDTSKPFGCGAVLDEAARWKLLERLGVDEITGIARKSREKLEGFGIYTCAHFARANRWLVREQLTKKGEDLWFEINGTIANPLQTKRPFHKAMARGGSVGKATGDKLRVEAWLARNLERLIEALDTYEFYCDRVALFLGYKEGFGTLGRAVLLEPSAHFEELMPVFRELLDAGWRAGNRVHYMHVIAEELQFRAIYQQSLFSKKASFQPGIASIMRAANKKAGRFAVRTGATLPLADIYADAANDYDICDVQGKICF
jgi:nucleotidyltransferase/DNA polymerase involved in DNA repair